MIKFLINHLNLRNRIYLGYTITGAVSLLIAISIYSSFAALSTDIQNLTIYNKYAQNNMSLVGMMTEMQRQAMIYINEGHSSAAEQVGIIHEDMMRLIQADQSVTRKKDNTSVVQTKMNLNDYFATFREVYRQREFRQQLVREDLRIHASKAQQLIEQLLEKEAKKEMTLEYSRALNTLLQVEKNAYRYFDSLDSAFVKVALENIRKTRNLISGLLKSSHGDQDRLQEISAMLIKYENSFIEAVHRTRGYLFLVNVIMSAQAYEIIYQARRLSELTIDESARTELRILDEIASTHKALLWTLALLFIFIVVFSYIISKSITWPIERLTAAFMSLTMGSRNTEIPKYRLKDELGNLCQAAECFRLKNVELEMKKKDLDRSNDEMEQFVYTVSHDLKSPIVTSMGFIGIIKKMASQGMHEKAMEYLEKVVTANNRMSQLINDLLELSRVGRTDMDKKPIDLNILLNTFAKNQSERLASHCFTLHIAAGLPTIYANESRLFQLFENMLSNALKYVHNESGPEMRIGFKEDENNLLIYLKDNGPGIPAEFHDKIFGLFYRLESGSEGTGIGLAVAKRIMKFHNGDIWVESAQGEGAAFWLKFQKYQEGANNE